jgi:hypothetical protein
MSGYQLFHVDDCMYVAAADRAAAAAYVAEECGDGCADRIEDASLDMIVTTANLDDGEKATPDTMTTAKALVEEHLKYGGSLPFTVCFDAGM